MWFKGPYSGKPRRFLLLIVLIFTCCISSFGKKTNSNSNGSSGSQLTISSVSPNGGPATGGTLVTITGTGFWHSTSVTFGGVAAPAVTLINSDQLQALTPAHASGAVAVTVTGGTHGQSATLADGFTYNATSSTAMSIAGVSPSQGPTTGGTVVTITGSGFQTGAAVAFGSVQSTAVTVTGSTQISAMSPPESASTVGITVSTADSQSASLPSAFTYTSGPSISNVSPNSGPVTGGTTVTILGSGFQSGDKVAFGGITAASATIVSSTEIQAVTPASPAGTVSVAVADLNSQTGSLASAFTFFHTVSITWTSSTSSVAGYNVYRGSTSGGPYTKLNSALISGASFSDNNVQPGHTYFYVATAVDSNNVESADSNQAEAIVPSP